MQLNSIITNLIVIQPKLNIKTLLCVCTQILFGLLTWHQNRLVARGFDLDGVCKNSWGFCVPFQGHNVPAASQCLW